jgi:hypothetical protein
MIVCPVCEHPQSQGTECEVCGKQLAPPRAVAVPVAPLAELEVTSHPVATQVAPAPLLELERTQLPAAALLPGAPMLDLEVLRAPAVTVAGQPLPELEQHRAAPVLLQQAPAPTGGAVCRYCRNVQAQGLLCDRCGMRIARVGAAAAPTAPAARGGEPQVVRHGCGAPTPAGRPCTSCGVFVPFPE